MCPAGDTRQKAIEHGRVLLVVLPVCRRDEQIDQRSVILLQLVLRA